jgi:hypothetical protein
MMHTLLFTVLAFVFFTRLGIAGIIWCITCTGAKQEEDSTWSHPSSSQPGSSFQSSGSWSKEQSMTRN